MTRVFRTTAEIAIALALVALFAIALVWPWPAPHVDWRTPLEAALKKNDCRRADTIMDAATSAGSIEAYELLAQLKGRNPCFPAETSIEHPDRMAAGLRLQRDRDGTDAWEGNPTFVQYTNALGFWLRNYVRAAVFLCARPYNSTLHTDFVEISIALPEQIGLLLAFHRHRREICIAILEDLAVALAEHAEPQAKELAYIFVMNTSAPRSAARGLVLAALFLEQQFVPDWLSRDKDSHMLAAMRSLAWIGLTDAAESGNPKAITMMISLLSKHRFTKESVDPNAQEKEAYFWILRSRRLGLPATPLYAEIEHALAAADRKRIQESERAGWEVRHRLTTER